MGVEVFVDFFWWMSRKRLVVYVDVLWGFGSSVFVSWGAMVVLVFVRERCVRRVFVCDVFYGLRKSP